MQRVSIKNVLIQALRPSRSLVMFNKLRRRLMDEKGGHSHSENLKWIKSNVSSFRNLAISLDEALWKEAEMAAQTIELEAEKKLERIEHTLGGGGIYPFLYFITRLTDAKCIVETGVAAGFSSYAFLLAIKANGEGRLYSSDFPYIRLPKPEQFIGVVVEDSLKDNWDLYIDGDEVNLPRILSKISNIDIFHYDSDKSYSGRKNALSMIEDSLSQDAIIVMDDIQVNSHFYDYVQERNLTSWHVFEFQGKYIGMIGELKRRRA